MQTDGCIKYECGSRAESRDISLHSWNLLRLKTCHLVFKQNHRRICPERIDKDGPTIAGSDCTLSSHTLANGLSPRRTSSQTVLSFNNSPCFLSESSV